MVGSFCELPYRLIYHLCCFVLTWPCIAAAGKESLWTLHNAAHLVYFQLYSWLCSFLWIGILSPSAPFDAYKDDISLERPPRPKPPAGYDAEANTHAEKAHETCCSCPCCCAGCQAFSACLRKAPRYSNRMFRSAFCFLSCHHSCHPALICGPLCTEPGCCTCCEGWSSRWDRWDREATAAKAQRTSEFYAKKGRVSTTEASLAPSTAVGKPSQMEMH